MYSPRIHDGIHGEDIESVLSDVNSQEDEPAHGSVPNTEVHPHASPDLGEHEKPLQIGSCSTWGALSKNQ